MVDPGLRDSAYGSRCPRGPVRRRGAEHGGGAGAWLCWLLPTPARTMLPDVLPLIAGLGLFMLGMKLLEDALAALAGLSLRRFLRSHASTPPRGLVIGAAATA